MKVKSPKPLFDNLNWLSELVCLQVKEHLCSLDLDYCEKEYELARRFLLCYAGSEDTFNSYRREVERLYQWAWVYKKKSIKELDRHDIDGYFNFVKNPPESWVSKKHSQRFKTNEHGARVFVENWRPFLLREGKRLIEG